MFRTDCSHWRGDKPCSENRLCPGCNRYQKLGPRILVIKLGARGDVLRTTPLATALKKRSPDSHLTWVTRPEAIELLQGIPEIDRLLAFGLESTLELQGRRFEEVICLDKEPWALGLAEGVRAERKHGWRLAEDGTGTPAPATLEAQYSLALGVVDELKFKRNTKHYLEIIFEACGLTYQGEPYRFHLQAADRERASDFFKRQGVRPKTPILGLFTGCGRAFPLKRWTEEGFAQLAHKAQRELKAPKARVLLMCGPDERAINQHIRQRSGEPLLDTAGEHSLRELAGFLEACHLVVTGDTVALHLALALGRPTIALFGPTASQEIHLFGQGEKVVASIPCAPCYRNACELKPSCMDSITVDQVWQAVQRHWQAE